MKNLFYFLCFTLIFSLPAYSEDSESLQLNMGISKNIIKGNVAVYNLSNGKLHTPDCEWAAKCTTNCIYINKRELKKIFFIPCAVCGGGIIEPAEEYLQNEETKHHN